MGGSDNVVCARKIISFLSPSTRWADRATLSRVRDQMWRLWACFTPAILPRSSFTASYLMLFGAAGRDMKEQEGRRGGRERRKEWRSGEAEYNRITSTTRKLNTNDSHEHHMTITWLTIVPSMSTRSASFSILKVEMSTRTEKRKVQIGSAIFHSGCVCVCVCVCVCMVN